MICRCLFIFLAFSFFSSSAWGISEWHGKNANFELRGFARLSGSYLHYSSNPLVEEKDEGAGGGVFRLLGDGALGPRINVGMNFLQEILFLNSDESNLRDVERSDLFTWQQAEKNDYIAQFSLDTLVAQWRSTRLDLSFGRQPVNLATTFFFTPNDFFAPFAAQTFFRSYKSGVDAARAEIRLGDLSQLSLIGVLSYDQDKQADTGWEEEPDWRDTSLLARFVTNRWDWEWAFLAGTIHEETVLGGSFQGEFIQWLGIRTEGHFASPDKGQGDDRLELCLGLEHRFDNSLDIRFEYFYHGGGFGTMDKASTVLFTGEEYGGYLGKNYTAVSATYEFTPLLYGQVLLLVNWTDSSRLWSGYGVYSLSDESDMALTFSLPCGDTPDQQGIHSEFGSLPYAAALEYRLYF